MLSVILFISMSDPALPWVAGEARPLIPGPDGTVQSTPPKQSVLK